MEHLSQVYPPCAGLSLMPLLAMPEARPVGVPDDTADLAATACQAVCRNVREMRAITS